MKVNSYCVYNFRSVEDSGWIGCNATTTLVGVNESGKTNILKALWKFNPVSEGKIDVLHDMPVTRLSQLRDEINQEFIDRVRLPMCPALSHGFEGRL